MPSSTTGHWLHDVNFAENPPPTGRDGAIVVWRGDGESRSPRWSRRLESPLYGRLVDSRTRRSHVCRVLLLARVEGSCRAVLLSQCSPQRRAQRYFSSPPRAPPPSCRSDGAPPPPTQELARTGRCLRSLLPRCLFPALAFKVFVHLWIGSHHICYC